MSELHRPHGTFEDNDSLSRLQGADISDADVDALDCLLNSMTPKHGVPETRTISQRVRSKFRKPLSRAATEPEVLAGVARGFQQRLERAQSARAGGTAPDPHLWESIMQATMVQPAVAAPVPRQREATKGKLVTPVSMRRPFERSRHLGWSAFASAAAIMLLLVGGIAAWQGQGGFGGGSGNADGSGLAVIWAEGTPEGTAGCPAVSKSEGEVAYFTDAEELHQNLENCLGEYDWPAGFEPDLDAYAEQSGFGDGRIDSGAARSIMNGFNECAWDITWLEARANGDAALEAEALYYITDVVPAFGEPGLQSRRDTAAAAALQGDTSEIERHVSVNCYPLWWAHHDATPPASENLSTPVSGPATPVVSLDCDFRKSMPVFRYVAAVPIDDTALLLADDGTLSLACKGNETVLAQDVTGVMPLDWPGRVIVTQQPERIDILRQAVLDITTGTLIPIGQQRESMTYRYSSPEASPWLVVPAVDDPSDWVIVDLRTMESRLLSSFTGAVVPDDVTRMLIAGDGPNGTLLISPQGEQGAGKAATGAAWPGDALVLDGGFDSTHWIDFPADLPPVQAAQFSPDGRHLALKLGAVDDHIQEEVTFSIVNSADGSVVSTSGTFENHGSSSGAEAVWVQGGQALLFTQEADLNLMPVDGGEISTVYTDPEPDLGWVWDIRVTSDPNLVLIGRDSARGVSEEASDAMERLWVSVNLATGVTQAYSGIDAGYAAWMPVDRYLVMWQLEDWHNETVSFRVIDVLTGQEIGQIDDIPNADVEHGFSLGPDSVASSLDGDVKVIAFDPAHMFMMHPADGVAEIEPIAAPAGLAVSTGSVTLNMSPDGAWLMLTAEDDPSNTRWMLRLDDPAAQWIEVPNAAEQDPGYISFLPGVPEGSDG